MSFLTKKIINFEPVIFGLDLSDLSIKVLQLERDGRREKVRSYFSLEIPPGNIEDGKIINKEKVTEYIREAVKKARPKKIKTNKVICSLPESKVFLRMINVPDINESEVVEAIKWEMESNIPMSIEQVYFDWQFLDSGEKNKRNVLTAAISREIVDDLMEVLKKANLSVYGLEVESVASARSLVSQRENGGKMDGEKNAKKTGSEKADRQNGQVETKKDKREIGEKNSGVENKEEIGKEKKNEISGGEARESGACLIVDLGAQRTSFIMAVKGVPYFTSSIPFSSEGINDAIKKAMNLGEKEAEETKINYGIENFEDGNPVFSAVKPLLENLVQEIEKTLDFFGILSKEALAIEKIILCGGGANLKGLIVFLEKRLSKAVEMGNPWANISLGKKLPDISNESALRYATAIGLALRGLDYEA